MKKSSQLPPSLATKLLKGSTSYDEDFNIVDTLHDLYCHKFKDEGKRIADFWYWRQVLWSIPKNLHERCIWRLVMIKNYFKIALRNLMRHRGFSLIIIFGLAVGFASSLLVFLYVFDEINYDRFHKDANRIYRIISELKTKDYEDKMLHTSYILAEKLRNDYPEEFQVTQVKLRGSIVTVNLKSYGNDRIIGADDHFFNFFTYPFIIGNPKTALHSPNEVVITDEAAMKYFGNTQAIGQTIQIDGIPYKISGIIEDNHQNAHFYFDVVFSLKSLHNYGDTRYLHGYYSTYAKLPPSVPLSRLEYILTEYSENNLAPLLADAGGSISFVCEPLLDIHLHSDLNGPYGANSKIEYVYIFTGIAMLILLIACINYVNLTNAKNLNRAKEVGIRKMVGSMRRQIGRQFLLESIIICWIAMGFAFIILSTVLPSFNNLIGKAIHINVLSRPLLITGLVLFATIIGAMAGIYPALYLSSFEPAKVLKAMNRYGRKKFKLQSTLVVIQFTISVIFIISTLVVNEQLGMVRKMNLGFDKERIIVLHGGGALGRQKEAFKNNLLKHAHIRNVTGASSLPGGEFSSWAVTSEDGVADELGIYFCDDRFAETMGIAIQQGRFLSEKNPGDERAIVVNEEVAERFGWTENPIGKKIRLNVHGDYTVIGVVKNFHYESLHNRLGRMGMIITQGRYYDMEEYIAIKYTSQNTVDVINTIKKEWDAIIPDAPFDYSFFDEDYYRLYQREQRMHKIASLFSFLAIFISALGIFGLVSFTVEIRKKEIGVRKVLGATFASVELLLAKDYLKWVLLANMIAYPIAYFTMNQWLDDFAYRIDLSIWIFVISGLATLTIALLTVGYQTIKAATANPVDSLRYE